MQLFQHFVQIFYQWCHKHGVDVHSEQMPHTQKVLSAVGSLYVSLLLHEKAHIEWSDIVLEYSEGALLDFVIEAIETTPLNSLVDDEVTHQRQVILNELLRHLKLKQLDIL